MRFRHPALVILDLPDPEGADLDDQERAVEAMKRLGADGEAARAAWPALADQMQAALDRGERPGPVTAAMFEQMDDQQFRFRDATWSAWRALLHWLLASEGEAVPDDWPEA